MDNNAASESAFILLSVTSLPGTVKRNMQVWTVTAH